MPRSAWLSLGWRQSPSVEVVLSLSATATITSTTIALTNPLTPNLGVIPYRHPNRPGASSTGGPWGAGVEDSEMAVVVDELQTLHVVDCRSWSIVLSQEIPEGVLRAPIWLGDEGSGANAVTSGANAVNSGANAVTSGANGKQLVLLTRANSLLWIRMDGGLRCHVSRLAFDPLGFHVHDVAVDGANRIIAVGQGKCPGM